MDPIRFGTDGWRGVIAEDYTFQNLRRVAQAYADYLKEKGAREVVVGFDARFLSERFALETCRVLAANGLLARVAQRLVPTPVTSFAVVHFGRIGHAGDRGRGRGPARRPPPEDQRGGGHRAL